MKRMTGAAKDATTEVIAIWNVEADRIAAEISGRKKKNPRSAECGMDGLEGPLL